MSKEFEQISLKPGFMKHNGGVLFKDSLHVKRCLFNFWNIFVLFLLFKSSY